MAKRKKKNPSVDVGSNPAQDEVKKEVTQPDYEAIKEMEKAVRKEAMKKAQPAASAVELCSFDQWYAQRSSKIPSQHRKEVLKADIKSRLKKSNNSMADYDAALAQYGVKLG